MDLCKTSFKTSINSHWHLQDWVMMIPSFEFGIICWAITAAVLESIRPKKDLHREKKPLCCSSVLDIWHESHRWHCSSLLVQFATDSNLLFSFFSLSQIKGNSPVHIKRCKQQNPENVQVLKLFNWISYSLESLVNEQKEASDPQICCTVDTIARIS